MAVTAHECHGFHNFVKRSSKRAAKRKSKDGVHQQIEVRKNGGRHRHCIVHGHVVCCELCDQRVKQFGRFWPA
jgi:hypothetical protein